MILSCCKLAGLYVRLCPLLDGICTAQLGILGLRLLMANCLGLKWEGPVVLEWEELVPSCCLQIVGVIVA